MWHSPNIQTMCFGISTLDTMPRRMQIFKDETKVIWEVAGKKNEAFSPEAIRMLCHNLVIF